MSDRSASHPSCIDPARLLGECTVGRSRGSGPGGQHRNKVETRITLCHQPTGIKAEASERRSQRDNQRVALFRLRIRLAVEVRQAVSKPYQPSELWLSRCRGGKVSVNERHEDFPAMLAEALDVIAGCDWDIRSSADVLGCSTTQLVKLMKVEPRALVQINRHRQQQGLPSLR